MVKKISAICLSILLCVSCLTGCGSFPNLTDEEQDIIAEYAADLLIKYTANSPNRLTDTTGVVAQTPEPIEEEKPVVEEEVVEEVPQNDAEVLDSTSQEMQEATSTYATIADALLLQGVMVDYQEYSILDSYPDGGESYFSLDATSGSKLLVLRFNITNNSSESIALDFMESSTRFKVSLDGMGYKNTLATMLLDDLSTYVGTIPAGGMEEVVLITEWKEEDLNNISALTFYIKNNDDITSTFLLN